MRIVEMHSHLNGEDALIVRHSAAYEELKAVIARIDGEKAKTKESREKTMVGKMLYSPVALNLAFEEELNQRGWAESIYRYYLTTQREHMERLLPLSLADQRSYLEANGIKPIVSYKQTDFVKDKIAVEVQFGKYAFVAFDLFVKHLLFYQGGLIDVGIEILPVHSMLNDPAGGRSMSSGVACYESEVYNLLRHGRGSPGVPLLILGIAP